MDSTKGASVGTASVGTASVGTASVETASVGTASVGTASVETAVSRKLSARGPTQGSHGNRRCASVRMIYASSVLPRAS
ncbi:MAG: hypothetical protein FGM24_01345 [Candidatus Kapabacteria bacterium]|nr:hypothetical protein [Candidatus Kapabacteria bacterium]